MNAARLCWALLALTGATASRDAAAQSLTSATLSGTVRAGDGTPLGDALVTVQESPGGLSRAATTLRDGAFSFPLLSAGTYDVLVERLGYRPKRLVGIVVAAGSVVQVPALLTLATAGDGAAEVEDYAGRLAPSGPALVDRVSLLPHVPDMRHDVADLASRSAALTEDLGGEGLPNTYSGVFWDGLAFLPARHPSYVGIQNLMPLPRSAVGTADLVANGPDVEWGGAAGPIMSAHSLHASGPLRARIAGDFSGDALSSSKYFDTGAVPGSSVRATALLGGSLKGDSAAVLVGVDVQRLEQAHAGRWPANALAAALVDVAQDSFATDLSDYSAPGISTTRVTTAFGRFDWRASRNHTVSFRAAATRADVDADALGVTTAGEGAGVVGKDFGGLVAVSSVLKPRLWQELRLSFLRSSRDYGPADVPSTRIADAGLAFGGDPSFGADVKRTTVQALDALHITLPRHRLKVGGGMTLASIDQTYADEAAGAFVFAGTGELAARRGVFEQTVGTPAIAKFTAPEINLFAQDQWAAAPGLELVGGVRFESQSLPADEVTANDSLRDATGLRNRTVPSHLTRVAPRFGLRWDIGGHGSWVVRAAAGWYHAPAEPGLLGELITGDGGVRGRRGVGALGAWPDLPDSTAAPVLGSRISLLGPSFEAPRTTRLSVGLSRSLGTAALHVTGHYRHTDFLARRADLNRLSAPTGTDQFGRPLYGTLVQQGSLLAAQGNRRFTSFDRIWALNADGVSDYYGVTVTLQREARRGPRFLVSYTYSRTTDNWLGGRNGAAALQLNPFPDSVGGSDWADGRSDFDVPHRVIVGAELHLPGPFAPVLAGLVRYESGAPFTPGFRPGVDANGDGADNDPVFVDDAVPGVAALTDAWDCLRTQIDQFAERNSCREPGRSRLDLRLTLQPFRLGGTPVQLIIDALNVVETDAGLRDHALYLVDRTGTLTTNATTGVVTVPLIANPGFGNVLARRSSGRALRLGLRVGG